MANTKETREIYPVVDHLLQAGGKLGSKTGTPLEVVHGVELVYGEFPYKQRGIVYPERALTERVRSQPVLALRERDRVRPLAYAEDVVTLPTSLAGKILGVLEALR